MFKWLHAETHQALQLPSGSRVSAILRDGPSQAGLPPLPGEKGWSSADRLAFVLVGRAIQADRKESNRSLLGRFGEAIGLIRGKNERLLRGTGEVVLRALVDGVPAALLDRRDTVFGVTAVVGGIDEQGEVGARFGRSHTNYLDAAVNFGAAVGDRIVGAPSPRIDRSYQLRGAFESDIDPYVSIPGDTTSIARRLGALADSLQSSSSDVRVEVLGPDARSIGHSVNGLAKDSLVYHLPVPVGAGPSK